MTKGDYRDRVFRLREALQTLQPHDVRNDVAEVFGVNLDRLNAIVSDLAREAQETFSQPDDDDYDEKLKTLKANLLAIFRAT